MKLKSTLWALAFACAAVSCSDDLNDNPNTNGNGNETSGETAKMKVIINTGVTTKAVPGDPDYNAEEGQGNEKGSLEESQVKDLTVFLFKSADGSETTTTSIKLSDAVTFSEKSPIVAAGYTAVDNTTASDHPSNHEWEADVTITVTEGNDVTLAGNTYGVIAITNTGSNSLSNKTFTTVGDLADYLQTAIYTTNYGFVMSTHMLVDESNHASEVKFPAATETQTIPTAEVFVERLAAKIRINKDDNITDYMYSVKNSAGTETGDKVQLTNAAVLNQLTSGSYLLKRATSGSTEDLLAELTLSETASDKLLEDEEYSGSGASAKANFVIDPWTRKKDASTVFVTNDDGMTIAMPSVTLDNESKTLTYGNYLVGENKTASSEFLTYEEWYNALTTSTSNFNNQQLAAKALSDDTDPMTLAYTMENTTNVANSKQGFSTGVLFKATYYAKQTMDIATDGKSVSAADTEWSEESDDPDLTFYTYGSMKFASLEAIFAYTLAQQVSKTDDGNVPSDGTTGYYFYDSFKTDDEGNSSTFDAITVSDYKASKTYTEQRVADPFGYMAYLRNAIEEESDETTLGNVSGLQTFAEYIADDNNADKIYKSVKSYENGVCYYLYWIRHEDNKLPNKRGPMEFAIVRNNIYDLSVSGINTLGLSGIDVPNPDDGNEDETARMNVVVKVRNWVVRSNGNIIL